MPLLFSSSLISLLLLGLPIFIAFSVPVLIFLEFTTSTSPMLVIQRMFSGIDRFPLMAIPFFILAGNLMSTGGLSRRLMRLANSIVGPLPGGLAMTSVSTSMFFSAISGSAPATVVAVGRTMLPSMDAAGYPRPFSIGLLMGSGALGIVIPPSIFMIVYGSITGVSIGALFMAGIGAGLLYGFLFMLIAVIYAKVKNLPRASSWSIREIAASLRDCMWGLAIPVIVLGGIYGGFFTPTEAAAVTVAYAAFVTLVIYREMTLKDLYKVLLDSAVTTAQVMIIVAAASAFAWYLTTSGFAAAISAGLQQIGSDPLYVFLILNVVVLIAGMFLDPNSIVVILVPFLVAIATAVGIDLIHLGVVLSVNAAIGMFTPPFGLNLFVAGSIGVKYRDAVVGSLPFILVGLAALAILTYVPAVSMWLPAQVYPGIVR
jgi:C4-dicarboxylate transporter, DctM subunit